MIGDYRTNDRKPLPEDDFVGNAAPFVLKITLEYPPRETESLLGFMPKEGKNFYDFEKFPDKRFYGNIERAFGTLILNMLGGAVNDYANGVKMYRPDLLPVHTYGDCKTGFTIELEFIVVVECLNMNQDYSNANCRGEITPTAVVKSRQLPWYTLYIHCTYTYEFCRYRQN